MLISRRNLPAALALGAHAVSLRATPRRDAPEVWARTELYFGTNRANRRPVSDSEFSQFIAARLLPKSNARRRRAASRDSRAIQADVSAGIGPSRR